jgi:hypothetical protein
MVQVVELLDTLKLSRTLILCNVIGRLRIVADCGGGRLKVLCHDSEDFAGRILSSKVLQFAWASGIMEKLIDREKLKNRVSKGLGEQICAIVVAI